MMLMKLFKKKKRKWNTFLKITILLFFPSPLPPEIAQHRLQSEMDSTFNEQNAMVSKLCVVL